MPPRKVANIRKKSLLTKPEIGTAKINVPALKTTTIAAPTTVEYQSITLLADVQHLSFEEIRFKQSTEDLPLYKFVATSQVVETPGAPLFGASSASSFAPSSSSFGAPFSLKAVPPSLSSGAPSSVSFGASSSTSFGALSSSATVPSSSFGAPSSSSFGNPSPFGVLSFGVPLSSAATAPSLSFGLPSLAAAPSISSDAPAVSFGSAATVPPTSFGLSSSFGAPSLPSCSFGAPSSLSSGALSSSGASPFSAFNTSSFTGFSSSPSCSAPSLSFGAPSSSFSTFGAPAVSAVNSAPSSSLSGITSQGFANPLVASGLSFAPQIPFSVPTATTSYWGTRVESLTKPWKFGWTENHHFSPSFVAPPDLPLSSSVFPRQLSISVFSSSLSDTADSNSYSNSSLPPSFSSISSAPSSTITNLSFFPPPPSYSSLTASASSSDSLLGCVKVNGEIYHSTNVNEQTNSFEELRWGLLSTTFTSTTTAATTTTTTTTTTTDDNSSRNINGSHSVSDSLSALVNLTPEPSFTVTPETSLTTALPSVDLLGIDLAPKLGVEVDSELPDRAHWVAVSDFSVKLVKKAAANNNDTNDVALEKFIVLQVLKNVCGEGHNNFGVFFRRGRVGEIGQQWLTLFAHPENAVGAYHAKLMAKTGGGFAQNLPGKYFIQSRGFQPSVQQSSLSKLQHTQQQQSQQPQPQQQQQQQQQVPTVNVLLSSLSLDSKPLKTTGAKKQAQQLCGYCRAPGHRKTANRGGVSTVLCPKLKQEMGIA